MINSIHKARISGLKKKYDSLRVGKDSLLTLLEEAELPEVVYNSNAIENSTLTLKETEKILLEQEVMRDVSIRELYEAKNLARLLEYLRTRPNFELSIENILLLHQMLIGGIDDTIAGRLRKEDEYVRIGTHIAPAPELLRDLLEQALRSYSTDIEAYFLDRISYHHLEFERIHPFCDGNGRIGRVLINVQLASVGLPPVVVRNKSKRELYYPAFKAFIDNASTDILEQLLALAVTESLHKRIAYLESKKIVKLTDYARSTGQVVNTVLNAARRQTLPAFREKGIWKIGV